MMKSGHSKAAEVRIENVMKKFGSVMAVDNISLDVRESEFLTLLGPSGSGKTTTLMIIAGFERADEGQIYLNQKSIINIPAYNRNIGMVFQQYALFPHMKVFDNVAYPLRVRKIPRWEIREKVTDMLELVELSNFEERYPDQLSGGQQQRVALARALVFNPPLLLLDEPLGALDKKLREHMKLEIRKIQKSLNLTAIYVTHDQEEALSVSDRIAVYDHGKILQVGTPEELYENPANKFVADFIGTSNFIPARFEGVKDGLMTWSDVQNNMIKYETRSSHDISPGQSVVLALRPEKIFFANESGDMKNVLKGSVIEVIFTGESSRYRIKIDETKVIEIRCQNKFGERKHKVGDKVRISWHMEDCKILS
jgi:putative spermidine/putrescine transport system ATP-binding protein